MKSAFLIRGLVWLLCFLQALSYNCAPWRTSQAKFNAQKRDMADYNELGVPHSWFAKAPSSEPKAGDKTKKVDAIDYLRDVLGLPEATLEKIVVSWPSMVHYNAQDHIIPTVKRDAWQVLQGFGLKISDVRSMLSSVPAILTLEREYSLPERLLSIKQLFSLSTASLAEVVRQQPYLVTASIDRNMEIASLLRDTLQLRPSQMHGLVARCPQVAMTSKPVLLQVWQLLTGPCGLPAKEARALLLRCPRLL
eukprot:gene42027-51308_t